MSSLKEKKRENELIKKENVDRERIPFLSMGPYFSFS